MRKLLVTLGLAALMAAPVLGADEAAAPAPAEKPMPYKSQKENASYAIGVNFGSSLKQDLVEIDVDVLAQGMKDAMAGAPRMTREQIGATMEALQKDLMEKFAQKMKEQAAVNSKTGDVFRAEFKKQEGVKELPGGLLYKVAKAGEGASPKATDVVKVHYRGTLVDGTEFDSSMGGEPATFQVNRVIKGWTEALQQMKVGAKWQIVIPPEMAYGEQGAGGEIGPGATLIFDVELLGIEKAEEEALK